MLEVSVKEPLTNRSVAVDEELAARVCLYVPDLPPSNTPSRYRYIQGLLGSTGLDSGTTNMNVDGSSTAQEFFVSSSNDYDLYIAGIGLLINDTAANLNAYGNVSALTNGVDLIAEEAGTETKILNSAQTGGEVIFQMSPDQFFGDGTLLNEIPNWKTNEDANFAFFNAAKFVPGGIRIGRGTEDRLRFVVNDNLTGLIDHECRIYGYRHYPRGA